MYLLGRQYPPTADSFHGLAELLTGAPYFFLICHADGTLSVDDPEIDSECRWTLDHESVQQLINTGQLPDDIVR